MNAWKSFWIENHDKYSVFHFHTPTLANIYALKMAHRYGVSKIIVHAHNTHANKGNLQIIHDIVHKYHRNKINKYATKFYACSKPAAEWVFGGTNLNKYHVEIFLNGIDTNKFVFNETVRDKYRNELSVQDKLVIGHVGRFANQKNHLFLVDIFYEIQKINKKAILMLIGEGELKGKIVEKVDKLKLNDKVLFLGVRDDIASLMMAMDKFVFPSFHEGLGIVVIEAQAAGLESYVSDKIPKDTKITNIINYLALNEAPSNWAEKIVKENKIDRISSSEKVKSVGYDISETTKMYEHYLLSEEQ
jgi:glycosyltransferase involved in cell wall biosynthesis